MVSKRCILLLPSKTLFWLCPIANLLLLLILYYFLYIGNACHYSPYHPSAITVGSLLDDSGDGANDKAPTSNYGECIDVWGEFSSCFTDAYHLFYSLTHISNHLSYLHILM